MINSSERDLIVGVMKRAAEDLKEEATDLPSKDKMKARKDAERWFRSNRTGAFSFLWCVDHLELDPIAIRRRIKGWKINEW